MTKTRLILVMMAVLAIGMGLASAQITGEPMEGRTRNHDTLGTGNVFGCPTSGNSGSPPCDNGAGGTIIYRFYSPDALSNGSINANVDSNPIYATTAKGGYVSDVDSSANYFGAGHAIAQMNLVFDGELRGGTGDHAGYYAALSQLIDENGEAGNTNRSDCVGTRGIQCFSPSTGAAGTSPIDTPQGTIAQEGGMIGVPVPTVSDGSITGQVTLSWADPTNEYVIDGGSGPVTGYNLYIRPDVGELDSRAVSDADLDGNAGLNSFHAKGSDGTAIITCAGLGNPGTYIPVGKVVYQDNDGGANPMEGLFWSANGPTIDCGGALLTEVTNFRGAYIGKAKGQTYVEVSWDTTLEDGTIAFNVLRGTSLNGPFAKVGTVQAEGGEGSSYFFEDLFKVPGNVRQVFYQLQVVEADGSDSAVGPVRTEIEKQTGRKN